MKLKHLNILLFNDICIFKQIFIIIKKRFILFVIHYTYYRLQYKKIKDVNKQLNNKFLFKLLIKA